MSTEDFVPQCHRSTNAPLYSQYGHRKSGLATDAQQCPFHIIQGKQYDLNNAKFLFLQLCSEQQQWFVLCVLSQLHVHFQFGEDTRLHQPQKLHQRVQQDMSRAGQEVPPTRYCCYVCLRWNKDTVCDWGIFSLCCIQVLRESFRNWHPWLTVIV